MERSLKSLARTNGSTLRVVVSQIGKTRSSPHSLCTTDTFTIQRIIGCDLKNPEFAYLSACHTTVGDEESPDKVIHLASAMQFVGLRSVIGTMWAVDDGQTNKITFTFYKYMVDEFGRLDHTHAVFTLNKTMKSVHDVPFDPLFRGPCEAQVYHQILALVLLTNPCLQCNPFGVGPWQNW